MSDLQVYNQHSECHERAWTAFTKIYILEHPKPTAPQWYHGLPYLMLPFSVVVLAGIALSALRTAPVFQQVALSTVGIELATAEALLAVVVIEVFLVLGRYAFILLSAQDGESNIGEVKQWMRAGFWIAFGIAVGANLYASIAHLPIVAPIKPIIDLVAALAVGISAPLLAFISADILGILWARSERRRADLWTAYKAAQEDWFEARERSWTTRKKDYGLRISVEAPPSSSVPALSNGISIGIPAENRGLEPSSSLPAESTLGHRKNRNARSLAEEWFDAYTGDVNAIDAEAIYKSLGIGKSTFYDVWKIRKAQAAQNNGTGE